jgi:diguanylate cyclase (GGDEF)-like protein
MTPISALSTSGSRLSARRIGAIAYLSAFLLGLCLTIVPAAAVPAPAPTLAALARRVRAADPDALHALQVAQQDVLRGAAYPERVAYLKLLRQAYADNGDAVSASDTDERIAQLALAHDDEPNAALGQLGRIDRLAARSPAEALVALGALDARHAQLRGPEFLAALQRAYGDVYLQLGQFDFALSHYLKAVDVARAHPGLLRPTVNDLRLALARVYVYTKAPAKVLAVLAAIGPGDGAVPARAAARAAINQGIAYSMQGRHDAARSAYLNGLALARKGHFLMLEANALANIADSWLQQERWAEAEASARAALVVAERTHDTGNIRTARANLGFALAGAGDIKAGLGYIDGVAAAFRSDDLLPDLANVLAEKSRALERAGMVRQSLHALQEQQAVAARLAAAERDNAVAMMQEQFNAQRRAAQIDGLRHENALKDDEIRQRRIWQIIASIGFALALALCGFVYRLYQRSVRTGRRLQVLNDELAFHSTHDALTGLLNRRSFRDTMAARAAKAPATLPGQCFILLDIDHFKAINDRLGHGAGDAVLVEVAARLRVAVGTRGLLVRWGGEEFLVYAEGGGPQGDARLVRELLEAVAATPFAGAEGERLDVTISAGALTLAPEGCNDSGNDNDIRSGAPADAGLEWEQALALADQALYLGKQNGRNRAYLAQTGAGGPGGAGSLRLTLIEPGSAGAPLRRAA